LPIPLDEVERIYNVENFSQSFVGVN
jgi:hypothetical protein